MDDLLVLQRQMRDQLWPACPWVLFFRTQDPSVFDRYDIVSERDLHDTTAKLGQHMKELEKARDKHNSEHFKSEVL